MSCAFIIYHPLVCRRKSPYIIRTELAFPRQNFKSGRSLQARSEHVHRFHTHPSCLLPVPHCSSQLNMSPAESAFVLRTKHILSFISLVATGSPLASDTWDTTLFPHHVCVYLSKDSAFHMPIVFSCHVTFLTCTNQILPQFLLTCPSKSFHINHLSCRYIRLYNKITIENFD